MRQISVRLNLFYENNFYSYHFSFQYICPVLVFIKQQEQAIRKAGPLVLIATQTKEVAKEILTQSQMFMQQSLCSFCCLFDDENINTQALQLREHEPDIIIGNYHRLCELLDNNLINLKNVSFLVMDDFYRNRSARLSDEIKRVVNETRVSILLLSKLFLFLFLIILAKFEFSLHIFSHFLKLIVV